MCCLAKNSEEKRRIANNLESPGMPVGGWARRGKWGAQLPKPRIERERAQDQIIGCDSVDTRRQDNVSQVVSNKRGVELHAGRGRTMNQRWTMIMNISPRTVVDQKGHSIFHTIYSRLSRLVGFGLPYTTPTSTELFHLNLTRAF